jgi:hypothetical protein
MPKLKTLYIDSCHQLSTIPSLPSLTHLSILSCNNIVAISCGGPCLQVARIENCNNLEQLFGFDWVRTLSIINCPKIKTIPYLENLHEVEIRSCKNLDLQSLYRENPSFWKKYIHLSDLSITDFSFCRNLYFLQLNDLPQLRNFSGIRNVGRLVVENCHNLITTEGLEEFIGRMDIRNCSSLTTVRGVKSITAVSIYRCPKFSEFEGIDNRENVIINMCPLFPRD